MISNVTKQQQPINFVELLTILFIGLKLTNYISWSWWWILSPMWGGFIVLVILTFIIA